jgi:tetratricopeptide (TPR) repeat protein
MIKIAERGGITIFDNEILSPNKKLKNIRNLIGATQEEISEGVCTKYLISQIENDKKKLNYKLALGLVENLNKIVTIKKIDILKITAGKLTEDEDIQANDLFRKNIVHKLKEINEIYALEEKLSEGEKLINKYNIEDNMKIDMYKLAANIYYLKENYNKSDEMCRYGLKVCLNTGNILEEASLYISKSRNNMDRKNYIVALEQLDYALKLNIDISNDKIFQRIYFNKALIYKKMSIYDKALKYLRILTDKFKLEEKKLLDVKMLHANCLIEQDKLEEAANEYIEILEPAMILDDKNLLAMAYRNLSEVYFKQKKYKDAAIAIEKSLDYNPDNSYLAENIYFASKVFKSIDEDVETYLLRALKICEKNNADNADIVEKIIYELVLIYIKREDEEKLMLITKKAKALNIDCTSLYLQLIEYYIDRKKEKSIKLIRELLNRIKEIKKY